MAASLFVWPDSLEGVYECKTGEVTEALVEIQAVADDKAIVDDKPGELEWHLGTASRGLRQQGHGREAARALAQDPSPQHAEGLARVDDVFDD